MVLSLESGDTVVMTGSLKNVGMGSMEHLLLGLTLKMQKVFTPVSVPGKLVVTLGRGWWVFNLDILIMQGCGCGNVGRVAHGSSLSPTVSHALEVIP